MVFNNVTHVLFDMDGLLLNTEDLYTIGFQNIVSPYGKEFTWELKTKIMGFHSKECADAIIKELQLPMTREMFANEANKQFTQLFPQCDLLPGAERLVRHLKKHNIPIGLATSSSIESYQLKTNTKHKEFFELFPYKTWGSSDPQVKCGKPSPDIFLVAAGKFPEKPDPAKVLVFEDAINGVEAAVSAGMQVVMVPDKRLNLTLVNNNVTQIINSLVDFKPELYGLPPYDD